MKPTPKTVYKYPGPDDTGGLAAPRGRARRAAFIVLLSLCLPLHLARAQGGDETGGIGGTGISNETGGVGGTGISDETGGIGGTGVHRIVGYGKIQAFGSVFVNGREYAITSNTLVSIDGTPATAANLKLGDLALVHGVAGPASHGAAMTISIRHAITGRIGAIASHGGSFRVLGQTVTTGPGTIIAGHPLAVGRMVTVSAQQRPDGVWVASRVAPAPAGAGLRLEATIATIDPRGARIRLGDVQAQASAALLAAAHPGERVFASLAQTKAGLKVTALAPATPELGPPGTTVEAEDFFAPSGEDELVSPDGLVAAAAGAVDLPSEAVEPSLVVGAIDPAGSIEISRIELPPVPQHGVLRQPGGALSEPHAGTQPESEATESGIETPEATEPSISEPQIIDPETTPPEIATPEINEPEIQTPEIPEPDIKTPEKD
jgi:hypothetical protein